MYLLLRLIDLKYPQQFKSFNKYQYRSKHENLSTHFNILILSH